jgi:hypothetical protein
MISKLFKGRPIYFKGLYEIRTDVNWAYPLDFPTIFVAFSTGIKSGNWQSCTNINVAKYIFDDYIQQDAKDVRYNNLTTDESLMLSELIFTLDNINNWSNLDRIKKLVVVANELIIKIGWK